MPSSWDLGKKNIDVFINNRISIQLCCRLKHFVWGLSHPRLSTGVVWHL